MTLCTQKQLMGERCDNPAKYTVVAQSKNGVELYDSGAACAPCAETQEKMARKYYPEADIFKHETENKQ